MGHRHGVHKVMDEAIAKIETNTQADCNDCALMVLVVIAVVALVAFIDDVHHGMHVLCYHLRLDCCYFY